MKLSIRVLCLMGLAFWFVYGQTQEPKGDKKPVGENPAKGAADEPKVAADAAKAAADATKVAADAAKVAADAPKAAPDAAKVATDAAKVAVDAAKVAADANGADSGKEEETLTYVDTPLTVLIDTLARTA